MNDSTLREAFREVLVESALLPPEERLIMYDACDEGEAARAPLGAMRKRLDSRRNTKPKKASGQLQVCTPFDPAGFHFGKIKNARERLLSLRLAGGDYHVLTNKFPLFPSHMLLVTAAPLPQQLTVTHLAAVLELVGGCSTFCAYFNSWRASASVNHFHAHLISEIPPVALLPLAPHPAPPTAARGRCLCPVGFQGDCYVLPAATPGVAELLAYLVGEMQAANQPHNLLFTPVHVYLWPKPIAGPPAASFDLYPETVGGPELIGSFTVYTSADYDKLTAAHADALTVLNTVPLPAHLLAAGAATCDDVGSADGANVPDTDADADADAAEFAAAVATGSGAATTGAAATAGAVTVGAATVGTAAAAAASAGKMSLAAADAAAAGEPIGKSVSLPEEVLRRLLAPKAPGWEGRRRDAGSGM